jgi:hypothetical protein
MSGAVEPGDAKWPKKGTPDRARWLALLAVLAACFVALAHPRVRAWFSAAPLSLGFALGDASPHDAERATPAVAADHESVAPQLRVRYDRRRDALSLDARDAPFERLLREFSDATGVAIDDRREAPTQRRVTFRLTDASVAEATGALLDGYDKVLFFAPADAPDGDPRLKRVLLLGRRSEVDADPAPDAPAESASTPDTPAQAARSAEPPP